MGKIQKVTLANFKGINEAIIDLGQITLLIGPNGTGKSSVAQALMMLKQSISRDTLIVNGPLLDLGDFNDILNRNSTDKSIGLGISIGLDDYQEAGLPKNSSFSYTASFNPQVHTLESIISTPKKKLFAAKMDSSGMAIDPPIYSWDFGPSIQISIKLKATNVVATPFVVGSYSSTGGYEKKAERTSNILRKLFLEINEVLGKIYYIPAIRGLELPKYTLTAQPNLDIPAGKNTELASTFAYADEDTKEMVAIWSEKVTGSEISPSLVRDRMVTVKSSAVKGGIPVTADGSGTNQLVHLLLMLAMTPSKSAIAIEEPEIHLHPEGQKRLCDLLVEISKAQNKQLIITTHSEYVLYAFVTAVKKDILTKEDLSIFYFEEKGALPYRVEQDDYGDIYDWGKNFFAMP